MKQILLIGSGNRMQHTVIPALLCLEGVYKISAIYSRTIKTISLLNGYFATTTTNNLESIDLQSIDVIYMAIATRENPKLLKQLTHNDVSHITLFIDTPVLNCRDLLAVRYFKHFKQVLAPEDNIALPPFVTAKQLMDKGKIGRLQKIIFHKNGYKYHAVAALKYLTGYYSDFSVKNKKLPNRETRKIFKFSTVVTADMLEPRDYGNCHFTIEGTEGYITDSSTVKMSQKRCLLLQYLEDSDAHEEVRDDTYSIETRSVNGHRLENLLDDSLMNRLKIIGLTKVLEEASNIRGIYHYAAIESIHDNLCMIVADKLGYVPHFLPIKQFIRAFK